MTKLYSVTVSFDFVVAVENDADLEKVCLESISDAFHDTSKELFGVDIIEYVPGDVSGWDNDCIPYGNAGDRTTGEILKGVA